MADSTGAGAHECTFGEQDTKSSSSRTGANVADLSILPVEIEGDDAITDASQDPRLLHDAHSSGNRSGGSKRLLSCWERLPTEMIDAILGCCCDAGDVKSLALTCRRFLPSARLRLYSELSYNKELSLHMLFLSYRAVEVKSYSALARTLSTQPEIASLVRKAHIGLRRLCTSEATAIAQVMHLLSQQDTFEGIWLQAWRGMPIGGQPTRLVDLRLYEDIRECDASPVLRKRLASILQIPSLKSITFGREFNNGADSDYVGWTASPHQPLEPSTASSIETASNVREMSFHYGSVPSPHTLRTILSQVRELQYLYIEFCSCSYQIWDRHCLAKLLDCLDRHAKSIATLCMDVTWAAFTTYETCSLVNMKSLRFIRINLDFIFPWKAVSGRHPRPQDPQIKPARSMLPKSLGTLVLKMCHSFWWTKSSYSLDLHPQDADAISLNSSDDASEDTADSAEDIESTQDAQPAKRKLELTPEALALMSWLGEIAPDKAYLPNLHTVVIVDSCPFRQHQEGTLMNLPRDWVQIPGLAQLSKTLLAKGVQLEFG